MSLSGIRQTRFLLVQHGAFNSLLRNDWIQIRGKQSSCVSRLGRFGRECEKIEESLFLFFSCEWTWWNGSQRIKGRRQVIMRRMPDAFHSKSKDSIAFVSQIAPGILWAIGILTHIDSSNTFISKHLVLLYHQLKRQQRGRVIPIVPSTSSYNALCTHNHIKVEVVNLLMHRFLSAHHFQQRCPLSSSSYPGLAALWGGDLFWNRDLDPFF